MSSLEKIKQHQESIVALKGQAVTELQERRKVAARNLQIIDEQIAELTGVAPKSATAKRARRASVKVGILQVAEAIRTGRTNNRTIAAVLNTTPAQVKKTIARDGKKAGIKSTGNRGTFAYILAK